MQPVYGIVSDAFGRVRVLRVALIGWAVANLVAAVAPGLPVLIAGRLLAGACAAAVIPVTAAYVGDHVAPQHRQRTMATLLAASAVGAAVATIVGGAAAALLTWRVALGIDAAGAVVLTLLLRRLPDAEPAAGPAGVGGPAAAVGVRARFGRAVRSGWIRFLIGFMFFEGAAMFGFYNFFNASLQEHGGGIFEAGAVTSAYGVAAVAAGRLVPVIAARVRPPLVFGAGALLLTIGYAAVAWRQSVAAVLVASWRAGAAPAVSLSPVQACVLEVAPAEARGTTTSLVACAVFIGAAVATASVGGLAGSGSFRALFAVGALVSLIVTAVGVAGLARFGARAAT